MEVKAKKYLGQHFLNDLGIAERISNTISPSHKTPILEIGPGMGVLTQFLLRNPNIDLTAIEIDTESVVYLKSHFPSLKLIEGDFLKMDLNRIFGDKEFCVIGNYPYNISSQIFFKVIENRDRIPICSGMIQKEVAERIAAKHGSKTYGITSVLLQAYYDIEYLFTVNENVFTPPPKVKSAVIRMTRKENNIVQCDEKLFFKVVKTAFNQRRKTMRNSLKSLLPSHDLNYDIFNLRPEQLSVVDFIELTNLVQQILSQPPQR